MMRLEITMRFDLHSDEYPIRETEANHYIDDKLMIGRLLLTNSRLLFRTHLQNFRQYNLTIPVSAITKVTYKNNLWLFSHGIWIHDDSGSIHHFSVWSRRRWKETIEQHISQKNQ